jgi:hypothetical protein
VDDAPPRITETVTDVETGARLSAVSTALLATSADAGRDAGAAVVSVVGGAVVVVLSLAGGLVSVVLVSLAGGLVFVVLVSLAGGPDVVVVVDAPPNAEAPCSNTSYVTLPLAPEAKAPMFHCMAVPSNVPPPAICSTRATWAMSGWSLRTAPVTPAGPGLA